MGKAVRRQRRDVAAARRRDPGAAHVADRAARAEAKVLAEANDLLGRAFPSTVGTATLDTLSELRRSALDWAVWPEWCWLPEGIILASITRHLGPRAMVAGDFHPALAMATASLGAIAAWAPGRLAVRFDPDLLEALRATGLRGRIPVEVLRRLPAWGLWLDVAFGSFDGCFVALTTSDVHTSTGELYGDPAVPRDTELLAVFVGGDDVAVTRLWITRGTIDQALREAELSQAEQEALADVGVGLATEMDGRNGAAFFSELLSLLLYLCSDGPDVVRRSVPARTASADGGADRETALTVASAGFRVGAALRAARQADRGGNNHSPGEGRVASHIRSAHWHTFWTGPRSEPALRAPVAKWLHPILVNAGDEVETVVRTAKPLE